MVDRNTEIRETLKLLSPVEVPFKKERFGPAKDGGYVVLAPLIGKNVLSFGVGTTIGFEKECAKRGCWVELFDHTVNKLPEDHQNFIFHKKKVTKDIFGLGLVSAPNTLQCDIEGDEWDIFAEKQNTDFFSSTNQIIIELHWFSLIHTKFDLYREALENIGEYFVPFHVHGNNWRDTIEIDGQELPDVLEVSYINRKYLQDVVPYKGTFPNELDYPNKAGVPDIQLGNFQW